MGDICGKCFLPKQICECGITITKKEYAESVVGVAKRAIFVGLIVGVLIGIGIGWLAARIFGG